MRRLDLGHIYTHIWLPVDLEDCFAIPVSLDVCGNFAAVPGGGGGYESPESLGVESLQVEVHVYSVTKITKCRHM